MRFPLSAPIALLTLTAACAPTAQSPAPDTAPRCLAAPSPDTTVYETSQVTVRPQRYAGPNLTYPMTAREEWVQGRVLIAMIVESTGEVHKTSIAVLESPDQRLTQSALAVVRGSQFKPGCIDERPVRVRIELPFDFRLGPPAADHQRP